MVLPRGGNTYGGLVFYQTLIVPTESGDEHEAMNALEAMDPFLPFRTLTAHIEHVIVQLAQFKEGLRDAGRAEPRAKNILIVGKVVLPEKAVDVGVITSSTISPHGSPGSCVAYY